LAAKMNAGVILRSMHRAINSTISNILSIRTVRGVTARNIHYVCDRRKLDHPQSSLSGHSTFNLLQPILPIYNSICGLKFKTQLQLRCKDCFLVARKERWFVMCKTHPRHKQAQIKKKEYKTWILTSASQNTHRTYRGNGNVKGTTVESLASISSHSSSSLLADFSFHKFSRTEDMTPSQAWK
ncbi:39S ribosomal protein L36, mitochondrial, partial [Ooceraea biroi]